MASAKFEEVTNETNAARRTLTGTDGPEFTTVTSEVRIESRFKKKQNQVHLNKTKV